MSAAVNKLDLQSGSVSVEGFAREKSAEAVAEGFLTIAVENMANAIKDISVRRGYDVTRYALCSFGGAGGQHACLVADALGMRTIVVHPHAGVLSAYGMGLADIRVLKERSAELPLERAAECEATLCEMDAVARAEVVEQGVPPERVSVLRRAQLRYVGVDASLEVEYGSAEQMERWFLEAHKARYGFVMAGKALSVENLVSEAVGAMANTGEEDEIPAAAADHELVAADTVQTYSEGEWRETQVYKRAEMARGDRVSGPAIVVEATGTTVLEPGWACEVNALGQLVLRRALAKERAAAAGTDGADPVTLEIFNNLFMSVAEMMGSTLENVSYSVNIKERLDFSCALFDADGELIANAPHIPVHLGAMSDSVQSILAARKGTMAPGDVYVSNAPYNGGTHIPDVTVITPVFSAATHAAAAADPSAFEPSQEEGGAPLFFVGSRGHHQEIGGISPGSVPPNSKSVEEEGVLFTDFLLVERGVFREAELMEKLLAPPYPSRNTETNLSDLRAQIAANECGIMELHKMVALFSPEVVAAYMQVRMMRLLLLLLLLLLLPLVLTLSFLQHVRANGEEEIRRVIADPSRISEGAFTYKMDDGEVEGAAECHISVRVSLDREQRTATIDFTGTSPQQPTNINAPKAIAKAAVLYVFRTLVDDNIPLNAGEAIGSACMDSCPLPRVASFCQRLLRLFGPLRLPAADHDRAAAALHAGAGAPGGRGRGQRGDEPVHHGRAVRRDGRDERLAGHNEQLHLRRRGRAAVLRDHLRRAGADKHACC